MKTILSLLLTILSFVPAYSAKNYTIETVPNVRLTNRFDHVSNPDGIITPEDAAQINTILNVLEDSLSIEIAVVALSSIEEGNDIRTFATDLFKHWGLGKKGEDNGLLILLVTNERAVVFETGYGIEGVLPDAICYRLQQKYMIPSLKVNNFSAGMLKGIEGVSSYLLSSDYNSANIPSSNPILSASETLKVKSGVSLYLLFCALVALFIGRRISTLGKRKPELNKVELFERAEESFRKVKLFGIFIFPAFPFLYLWYKLYKQILKKRTSVCPQCGGKHFLKLSEQDEMPYLSEQEQCENDLGSIDHSVYRCNDCLHTFKIATEPLFSSYSRCPRCGTKAFLSGGEHTIMRPTYSSTGIAEEVLTCKKCNHTERRRKTIDRLARSGGFAAGAGGALGGLGGGSFGGGFSGGGSWGGGGSGGGGSISRF